MKEKGRDNMFLKEYKITITMYWDIEQETAIDDTEVMKELETLAVHTDNDVWTKNELEVEVEVNADVIVKGER